MIGWGANAGGQSTPPASATNVVALAAGDNHSLALRADGTLVAWGENGDGQITIPPSATNVVAIAAGKYHSMVVKADGTILAWGRSDDGVLPIPTNTSRITLPATTHGAINRDVPGTYVNNYLITNDVSVTWSTS